MIDAVVLVIAALGHAAIWVAVINRTHASGWPHEAVEKIDKVFFLFLLVPPPVAVYWLSRVDVPSLMPWRVFSSAGPWSPGAVAWASYLVLCWLAAAATFAARLRWAFVHQASSILRFHRSRSLPTNHLLHCPDHPHHVIVHTPGNESLKLDLTERGLDLPRLPPALEGLSIVHLSDFHFTGRLGKPFFEEVVRRSNALAPDIVALTGDLIDKTPCLDWIPDTFGRLRARYGVYYILGNHDLRVDCRRLRRLMEDCGLVYLGGRWKAVMVRDQSIVLAGNELPWFKPAADLSDCPTRSEAPLRILLAHSPDQLPWARRAEGDLLLAGHNHGGQIRLPLIGPVFSPSRRGVQYASGLFYAPPTILNVSRGLSAEWPLRMNCSPEIIQLSLHRGGGLKCWAIAQASR